MRSPGGSTFPYFYLGGEIHCLKYGERGRDLDSLVQVVHAEQDFLLSVGTPQLVWVDLYGTRLGATGRRLLVAHLDALRPLLVKVAIVGARRMDPGRLRRAARRSATPLPRPTRFFTDPETAKTWLVRGQA